MKIKIVYILLTFVTFFFLITNILVGKFIQSIYQGINPYAVLLNSVITLLVGLVAIGLYYK